MGRYTQLRSDKVTVAYSHDTKVCTVDNDGDITSDIINPQQMWLIMQRYRKKLNKENTPYKVFQMEF